MFSGQVVGFSGFRTSIGDIGLGVLFDFSTGLVLFVFFERSAETAELIIFESETCEWCEVWDEEIGISYNKSREGSIAPLRRVDIDGDLPADLEHLEGLLYTPTFIVLDEIEGVDIDTELDWSHAVSLMKKGENND